jgi:hypothetical protein
MPATLLQWGPVLGTGAVMIALGLYSAFLGLHAERRRARLIYGLTLFAYTTWIYPALLGLASSVLFMHPDPHLLRVAALILQGAGIIVALYVSGRHAGYVFRIICCSIGILVGLVLGLVLRTMIGVANPIFGIVVPVVTAAAFGWLGWQEGPGIRSGWKIVCFAAAGAGMTASGSIAILVAWFRDEPLGQWVDLVLSILSPPLKYLVSGISFTEMLASFAVTAVIFVLGAATQCGQLKRTAPHETSVCNMINAALVRAGASLSARS